MKTLDNPVKELLKYQRNERMAEQQKTTLWLFMHAYVRRCEKSFYGTTDPSWSERRIERVLFLYAALREFKTYREEHHPYYDGSYYRPRYAKSCLLASVEHRHPNLILTNYRRSFCNVEALLMLKRNGVYYNNYGCYDMNTNEVHNISYLCRLHRTYSFTADATLLLRAWQASQPCTKQTVLDARKLLIYRFLQWTELRQPLEYKDSFQMTQLVPIEDDDG